LPVKLPRVALGVNAALGALLLWLYGGDVLDATRATSNEVAALSSMPLLPFAFAAIAGAVAGLGLTGFGAATKRDKTWRGYRVMPIVAVVVLFLDLFVLSATKSPFSSNARTLAAADLFEQRALQLSTVTAVPSDERALQPAVQSLGPVPWLVKGENLAEWQLKMVYGCTGPQLDVAGLRAGTIVYCVDTGRKEAWLTYVGLPFEQRFGPAQLVTQGGTPLVGRVRTAPPAEANDSPPSFTELPDAGTLDTP
jgi:hypothetical protein